MNIPLNHFSSGENLYTHVVAPVCEKYQLTYMEFSIIMFLYHNPEHDTATQISKIRRLTKSHVSISIRSLEQRGLILCEYRNQDHRTIHLSLTPDTQAITSDGVQAQDRFASMVFQGFSGSEMDLLLQYMDRIDQNIEKASLENLVKTGASNP